MPHWGAQGGCSRLGQLLVLRPAEGTELGWAGLAFTALWRTWDQGGAGVSSGTRFCSGAGDSYPAGSRCEWGQSQVGAEGKLGALSLCQLCWCHQGWRAVVRSCTLVPWGDLPEQSLLQSLPTLCLGWDGLWPCSLSGARVGKQPLLGDRDSAGCGGGRAALQLRPCWCPLGWCQGRLGHRLSVQLLTVSVGAQTVPAGSWRVEDCDREAVKPGKIRVSQGTDRASQGWSRRWGWVVMEQVRDGAGEGWSR